MPENTLGTVDPITSPEIMQNMDILDLCNRLDTYLLECNNCASATRHETSDHDSARMIALVARFKSRFESYKGDPELDLPKYHPKPLTMPEPPSLNRVENNDVQQFINMMAALRIEVAYSDSSERASGFKGADAIRIDKMIEKMEKHTQMIDDEDEIDLPDVDRQEPNVS